MAIRGRFGLPDHEGQVTHDDDITAMVQCTNSKSDLACVTLPRANGTFVLGAVTVLSLFAYCTNAHAQVVNGDFSSGGTSWTVTTPDNGSVVFTSSRLTATSDDNNGTNSTTIASQDITVGDPGFLSYDMVSYTSTDTGDFDRPIAVINGTTFRVATDGSLTTTTPSVNNANQATNLSGATPLAAGTHSIGFGVFSVDSIFGPGIAVWDNIEFQELTQSPSAQVTDEDTDLVLSGVNALQVATNTSVASMTVTVSVSNGALSLGAPGSVTITGGANGTASITFTGSASAINTALAGTTYTPNTDYNGADTLVFNVNAGGTVDTDNIAITVNPVDDFRFTIGKLVDVTDVTVTQTLTYTITIENTGDAALTGPVITDDLVQNGSSLTLTSGPTLVSGDTDGDNEVDASETWTYSATYDVTSANLADGNDLVNTATFDAAEVTAQSDNAVTTISPPPPPGGGGTTSCTGTALEVNGGFEVPNIPGSPPSFSFVNPATVPGWSTTDTAIEIWDSGFNGVPSDTGAQFAELNANSAGTLTQTGSVNSRAELLLYWKHRARVGTNTANLVVSDDGGGSTASGNFTSNTSAWNALSLVHLAGPSATSFNMAFTAVTGGSLGNFLDTIEACQTYITLGKTELSRQDVDTNGGDTAGDVITYRYTVTNPAGNVRSLGSVSVTDDQIGTINLSFPNSPDSGDTNGNGLLDPGEAWVIDADYTVTQTDMDAGDVVNIAHAQADTGDNIIRTDDATVTAVLAVNPLLSVSKTADDITDVTLNQVITYTYVVTNTGNQTITNISLGDSHNGSGPVPVPGSENLTADNGPAGDSLDPSGVNGSWDTLAPGDEVTFTATYTVTQSDIDTLQ